MTDEQRAAAKTCVEALEKGTWVRPPRDPETGERPTGPGVKFADGSQVFALRHSDGIIRWYLYASAGQQLAHGTADELS
jgi:hypothetical protein